MYSEYSRYNKTNTHIRIQDQKNHYQQIVNPRNTMRINTNDETRYMSLNHHNKHTHEI